MLKLGANILATSVLWPRITRLPYRGPASSDGDPASGIGTRRPTTAFGIPVKRRPALMRIDRMFNGYYIEHLLNVNPGLIEPGAWR